ncbi:MAG TPA: hypothetical protein VH479_01925 [Acidimicrobiales bacterium]|jgi:Flp pilus assembly pilin Flp
MTVLTLLHRLASRAQRDDKGAAMAEYGLLLAGIAAVVAAAAYAFGGGVAGLFNVPGL